MAEPPVLPPPLPAAQAVDLPDEIHMYSPGGAITRVKRADRVIAEAQGYRTATGAEIGQELRNQELGGWAGTIASLGAGAARGLTFGASDVIYGAAGLGDELQTLREVNPTASTVGEIGGGLVGVVGSGGSSLAARALSAPTRLVTGIGKVAERAASRVFGTGMLSRAASAVAEGTIAGAGMAVSEVALGADIDQLGELLAARAGLGAAISGGASLGLSLLGRGVSNVRDTVSRALTRPGATAAEQVATRHFGSSSGVGKKLAEYWGKLASVTGSADARAVAELGELGSAGAVRRRMALDADSLLKNEADSFAHDLGRVHSMVDSTGEQFTGKLKRSNIRRVISDDVDAALTNAQQAAAEARLKYDAVKSSGKLGLKGAKTELVEAQLKKTEDALARATLSRSMDDTTDLFMALDELKRQMGRSAQNLGKKWRGLTPQQRGTWEQMRAGALGLRSALEDEAAWGRAAMAQKALNAPWSDTISAMRDGFRSNFLESMEDASNKFGRQVEKVSRKKVQSFLDGLTNPAESEALGNLKTSLDAFDRFTATADEYLDLPPAQRQAIGRMQHDVNTLRNRIDSVTEIASRRAQFKSLTGTGNESLVAGVLGGALAMGSGPMAAVAALAQPLLNPSRTIRQLAAIEKLVGSGRSKVTTGFTKASQRATTPLPRSALRIAGPIYQEFEREAEQTRTLAQNRDVVADTSRKAFADISGVAPLTTDAATKALERQLDFMRKELPKVGTSTAAYRPPPSPTMFEVEATLERAHAIRNPEDLITKIVDNEASPIESEAIKATSPGIYRGMQNAALQMADDLSRQDKELPFDDRMAMSIHLDLILDEMAHPDMMREMQLAYVDDNQQEPRRMAPPTDPQRLKMFSAYTPAIDRRPR